MSMQSDRRDAIVGKACDGCMPSREELWEELWKDPDFYQRASLIDRRFPDESLSRVGYKVRRMRELRLDDRTFQGYKAYVYGAMRKNRGDTFKELHDKRTLEFSTLEHEAGRAINEPSSMPSPLDELIDAEFRELCSNVLQGKKTIQDIVKYFCSEWLESGTCPRCNEEFGNEKCCANCRFDFALGRGYSTIFAAVLKRIVGQL